MNQAPAIIPPERIIESVSRVGMVGYFEVELIHKPTGLVKQKLKFKNLITDAGLEWIGAGARTAGAGYIFGPVSYMGVGTGTTAPAITDTTLVAQVSRTNSNGSPVINPTYGMGPDSEYFFTRTTKVFLPGTGTGNLTEVGLFDAGSGGTMFARQLFRDGLGAPTTIVKTADDELRITYELRIYTQQTSNTTTLTVKSVSRTCTTRGYDIDGTNRWGNTVGNGGLRDYLGYLWRASQFDSGVVTTFTTSSMPPLTGTQIGTSTGFSSGGWQGSYIATSRYRDYAATMNPGVGNITIGSITWGGMDGVNAPFISTIEPAITKTETERFTFTGRLSWGRQ
jgi:hypothetical protein